MEEAFNTLISGAGGAIAAFLGLHRRQARLEERNRELEEDVREAKAAQADAEAKAERRFDSLNQALRDAIAQTSIRIEERIGNQFNRLEQVMGKKHDSLRTTLTAMMLLIENHETRLHALDDKTGPSMIPR